MSVFVFVDEEDEEDKEDEDEADDWTEMSSVWFDGCLLDVVVVVATWPPPSLPLTPLNVGGEVNEDEADEEEDEEEEEDEGDDEVGEVERDGEVSDEDEAVVSDVSESESLLLPIWVLNLLERRRKLPFPNISPAFGWRAQ